MKWFKRKPKPHYHCTDCGTPVDPDEVWWSWKCDTCQTAQTIREYREEERKGYGGTDE